MPRKCQKTELIKRSERRIKDIRVTKPNQVRKPRMVHREVICYEIPPEIRSVQQGRIRPGSVAPLLSRRAKALALMAHYNHYTKDEKNDASDNSDEDIFMDDADYDDDDDDDDEIYDHDHHYRSYNHYRSPISMNRDYVEYEEDLIPSSSSSSSLLHPISAAQFLRAQAQPKRRKATPKSIIKSAAATAVAVASKPISGVMIKKNVTCCEPKDKIKKTEVNLGVVRSGPITRSRGAALMN
uniref:BRF1 domain-containing protein n=1 Tax=Elaeophora elaphi TaxID=1147741 RepID=A0A0R3RQT7_9BILA